MELKHLNLFSENCSFTNSELPEGDKPYMRAKVNVGKKSSLFFFI